MKTTTCRCFKGRSMCLTFLFLLATTPLLVQADRLEEGRTAIGTGNYAKAHELLEPLAEAGDAVAQNAMGVLYIQGWGVSADPERAAQYFQRSAEQGNIKGTMNLADAYRTGKGVKQSCEKAKGLLTPIARGGLAKAQVVLGSIYDNGCSDFQSDPKKAFQWYSAAAAQGDPNGLGNVGAMYALGRGVENDYPEAMKHYREAAELGNGKAAYNLGRMYEFGEGMPPDLKQAEYWYQKAVSLGETEAEQRLMALTASGNKGSTISSDMLAEAMDAPPLALAQSYGSIKSVIELLPLVEAGVTLQLPHGEVNKKNVASVRSELEQQLSIFEKAIEKRGAINISGEYVATANRCDHSGSSWASLIAKGYDRIFVGQDGLEVAFEASKKRRRDNSDRTASGVCVENAIALVDPMNSDYTLVGEFHDGLITIRPDVDSILNAWPDFVQPPSRSNLTSCVVKLTPVGFSGKPHPSDDTDTFAPVTGKGVLYIYRAKKLMASESRFRVDLDDDIVGMIAPNEYYTLELEPGDYVLRVWYQAPMDEPSIGSLEVAVKSEEVHFIEIEPKMGFRAAKMAIEKVPADVGQGLILKGKALN